MVTIALIGAGRIGEKIADHLAVAQFPGTVVLYDIKPGLPQGIVLDIEHSLAFHGANATRLVGSNDIQSIAGADVCIVTAGVARTADPAQPPMSRDDLLAINARIIASVSDGIRTYAPQSFVIVVSNPVDTMAYLMYRRTGFPSNRVVGMAGSLDSARYRSLLAATLGVGITEVSAFVLGGHGDSMVPVRSSITINGIRLSDLTASFPLSEEQHESIEKRVRQAGGEIVQLLKTGSASSSPASAAIQTAMAYLNNERLVLSAPALCQGQYGATNLFVGVPVIIGAGGVEQVIEIPLSESEREALTTSIAAVQKSNQFIESWCTPVTP